ncbi:TatD family hydrolase [Marinobacterium sedimentorum]|uniref:TatD family hydrolase n=1 Tax=Marinobacterium sedimentorum TaxID=2927804 RepID=UPI0020C63110|nr:TatD family hydrolase [Marinobacterium sedimentorum]MCP8685933.1 TatD family hydrolase [Marinobacterium sedimentorum]
MESDLDLFDSHCHLDFDAFDGWRDQAMRNARSAGIRQILLPGVTAQHWPRLLQLCQRPSQTVANYPLLYPALGLHPCFMTEHRPEHLGLLQQRLVAGEALAVGEIGLDFFIPDCDAQAQQQLLEQQLLLARQFDLPVLLHVRKAHDQMLKTLRRLKLRRGGIVHAFSGSEQQAHIYIDLGFRLGFGGVISYERATRLRHLVATLPLESLVLETDSPDMPLSGWRDEPNRPERVADVLGVVAQLRAEPARQIARQTTNNACAVLGLAGG